MTTEASSQKRLTLDDVQKAVIETIISEGMVDAEKIEPNATIESLEIESIEFVMILNGLEERFDIYVPIDEDLTSIDTVADLSAEIYRRLTDDHAASA